jgi:hypothetical protein
MHVQQCIFNFYLRKQLNTILQIIGWEKRHNKKHYKKVKILEIFV